MAKRTFPEGFKEKAVAYPKEHPEKTMKECAADLEIGYSTLRRWINEAEEAASPVADVVEEKTVGADENVAEETVEKAMEETEQVTENEEAVAENVEEAQEEVTELEEALADAAEVLTDVLEETEAPVLESETLPNEGETVLEADAVEKVPAQEKDDIDDDPLFASIGASMGNAANVLPHDEDYALRCKSHPSSLKDINHMAGDVIVSMSAQIGNVIEDVTDGLGGVAERLQLYKKRHDLKKTRKLLKKEKEKRQKR
ncbi:MAG: hypothetical protein UDB11_11285 [Peptococcaceae bacterium]|nr:hypothetical protein [Peptococcaceae bacterium]